MCEKMKISGVEKLGINNLGRYVVYDFPIWEEKKYDYYCNMTALIQPERFKYHIRSNLIQFNSVSNSLIYEMI